MKVTFYGTRGSMPVAYPDYLHFGGNTSCVLVTFSSGNIAILDAGTGIWKLGKDLMKKSHKQYSNIYLILSHTHWDHIQGFPFFEMGYDPRRKFTISICGADRKGKPLESLLRNQMQKDLFPVPLEKMGAKFAFFQPNISTYEHPNGVKIVASKHCHRGDAFGYRIEEGGKTLVYCTDVEHTEGIDPNVVSLSANADLLIHDAQYTPEKLKSNKGWGHSSWEQAIEVAERAMVKKLALFHHDPENNDHFLSEMEKECQKNFSDVFFAREGSEIIL